MTSSLLQQTENIHWVFEPMRINRYTMFLIIKDDDEFNRSKLYSSNKLIICRYHIYLRSQVGRVVKASLLIKLARVQAGRTANIWSAIFWFLQGKAMGNHLCEKFPQEKLQWRVYLLSIVIADAQNRVQHLKKIYLYLYGYLH